MFDIGDEVGDNKNDIERSEITVLNDIGDEVGDNKNDIVVADGDNKTDIERSEITVLIAKR